MPLERFILREFPYAEQEGEPPHQEYESQIKPSGLEESKIRRSAVWLEFAGQQTSEEGRAQGK